VAFVFVLAAAALLLPRGSPAVLLLLGGSPAVLLPPTGSSSLSAAFGCALLGDGAVARLDVAAAFGGTGAFFEPAEATSAAAA
jgi:hypothetical protein